MDSRTLNRLSRLLKYIFRTGFGKLEFPRTRTIPIRACEDWSSPRSGKLLFESSADHIVVPEEQPYNFLPGIHRGITVYLELYGCSSGKYSRSGIFSEEQPYNFELYGCSSVIFITEIPLVIRLFLWHDDIYRHFQLSRQPHALKELTNAQFIQK